MHRFGSGDSKYQSVIISHNIKTLVLFMLLLFAKQTTRSCKMKYFNEIV